MGHLLDWILAKENRNACLFLGFFLLAAPVFYIFRNLIDEDLWKFALSMQVFLGIILLAGGYGKKSER